MARPATPKLTPISRGAALIARSELLAQIAAMDRLGTWHLAQALALQDGFDDGSVEEGKYHVNQLHRHLQLAGAMLGSINARIATFKFVQEEAREYPGGSAEQYEAARQR